MMNNEEKNMFKSKSKSESESLLGELLSDDIRVMLSYARKPWEIIESIPEGYEVDRLVTSEWTKHFLDGKCTEIEWGNSTVRGGSLYLNSSRAIEFLAEDCEVARFYMCVVLKASINVDPATPDKEPTDVISFCAVAVTIHDVYQVSLEHVLETVRTFGVRPVEFRIVKPGEQYLSHGFTIHMMPPYDSDYVSGFVRAVVRLVVE